MVLSSLFLNAEFPESSPHFTTHRRGYVRGGVSTHGFGGVSVFVTNILR